MLLQPALCLPCCAALTSCAFVPQTAGVMPRTSPSTCSLFRWCVSGGGLLLPRCLRRLGRTWLCTPVTSAWALHRPAGGSSSLDCLCLVLALAWPHAFAPPPLLICKQNWDPYSPAARANAQLAQEIAQDLEEAGAGTAEL